MRTGELESLVQRVGEQHVRHRLMIESSVLDAKTTFGYWKVPLRTTQRVNKVLEGLLRALAVFDVGQRNLTDFRLIENRARLPRLPAAFRGFRILHLSDLHIEAFPDGGEALRKFIAPIEADMLVLTGDYRFANAGACGEAMELVGRLVEGRAFAAGTYAVLGNHDSLEMVPSLEAKGIRVLLNESVPVRRGEDTLWVAGVDDPHFFELHDLDKALTGPHAEGFKMLLAHSPDIAELAAGSGVDFYLCGHAHGGQICLPGEVPILANLRVPRRLFRGAWSWHGMKGYTSRGSGASGVPVRYFSRPEVTLHILGG